MAEPVPDFSSHAGIASNTVERRSSLRREVKLKYSHARCWISASMKERYWLKTSLICGLSSGNKLTNLAYLVCYQSLQLRRRDASSEGKEEDGDTLTGA